MKNTARLFFGLVLVILGVSFFFQQIGVNNVVGTLWPLFIVALGAGLLVKGKTRGGLFFVFLGIIFLLSELLGWSIWALFWPLIIIWFGVTMLFGKRTGFWSATSGSVSSSSLNDNTFFWGTEKSITSKSFSGGEINCIFGGYKLDLTKAGIGKNGANLDINCIFGGAEIIVPKSMNVEVKGEGAFGGWDDKTSNENTKGGKLTIGGSAVFGGVQVRN